MAIAADGKGLGRSHCQPGLCVEGRKAESGEDRVLKCRE